MTATETPLAPPPTGSSIAIPAWVRAVLDRSGKLGALGLILCPLLGVAAIFMAIAIDEITCRRSFDPGCDQFNIYLTFGLEFFFAILLMLSISLLFGASGGRSAARDAQVRFGPLLQSAKDWFVRGDITEAEFDGLRGQIEPLLAGKGDEIRIRRAAGLLVWAAILFTVATIILVPVTLALIDDASGSYPDYQDPAEWPIAMSFVVGTLVVMLLMVTWWVLMARTRRVARSAAERTAEDIKRQEEKILRTANERRRGGEGVAAPAERSPSFRSFRGR